MKKFIALSVLALTLTACAAKEEAVVVEEAAPAEVGGVPADAAAPAEAPAAEAPAVE